MEKIRPKILVTNDDGINAAGLRALIEFLRPLGDVFVVASEGSMSGVGHSITVRTPLRVRKVSEEKGYQEYVCNGTPVDCVKLGTQIVMKQKPDIVVSGINHGSNAAVNVLYSGTMAAVVEACIDDISAVGFSLLDYSHDADFGHCGPFVTKIVKTVLEKGLPDSTCLNVNIPAVNGQEIQGVKICRQAKARWVEEFDVRKDPTDTDYYWLTGHFQRREDNGDTDQYALDNNFVSVVPVHYDLTAHAALKELNDWKLDV
jgi:5'/3'-nucleotidase